MTYTKFYLEHYGLNRHVIVQAYKCDEGCGIPFYYHGASFLNGYVKANNTCDHMTAPSTDRLEYCLDCREWGEQV